MTKIYKKTKDGSYIHNCVIAPRADRKEPLFWQSDETISCRLNGYAIIPIEEYERLTGKSTGIVSKPLEDAEKQLHGEE